jgi:hypothetical protein
MVILLAVVPDFPARSPGRQVLMIMLALLTSGLSLLMSELSALMSELSALTVAFRRRLMRLGCQIPAPRRARAA